MYIFDEFAVQFDTCHLSTPCFNLSTWINDLIVLTIWKSAGTLSPQSGYVMCLSFEKEISEYFLELQSKIYCYAIKAS